MQKSPPVETEDKDLPLRDDIRLLGRILGDTIREQSGDAVFETVENIRQNSVSFRRDEDLTARRDLEATLNSLRPKEALQIIRAFGFFSHLANIAEDQHHIRRTRAHSLGAAAPREGSIAHSLARARQTGVSPAALATFFSNAMVVPVLMISCQVSEKWKTGPVIAQAMIRTAAMAKAGVLPVQRVTALASLCAIDSVTPATAGFSGAADLGGDMRVP